MEKPVLAIGIIFISLFLFDLNRRGYLDSFKNRFNPTSCYGALPYLSKRLPKESKARCDNNNLRVSWTIAIGELIRVDKPEKILAANYRELANNLTFIAKNTPQELLNAITTVTLMQEGEDYTLTAISEGRKLSLLKDLKSPELIAEHLRNTVKVQEVTKR
jgi:hypothetical protein